MSATRSCAVCSAPSTQQCGNCRAVTYCGRDHQRLHWREGHKDNCSCYREEKGRQVATRDIQQGAEILRDKPVLTCPSTDSSCTCLGCHKQLQAEDETTYKCSKCQWSLCSKSCETALYHLKECAVLQKIKLEDNKYNVVAALRYLQLDDEKKKQLQHLQHALCTNSINISETNVPYTEDEMNKAYAIVSNNVIHISKSGTKAQAIFPKVTKIMHSCCPNTKNVFEEDVLVIVATVAIKKGDLITTSHIQVLSGTLDRRLMLLRDRCIECKCERCKDATEFGTYAGSIYCSRCDKFSDGIKPKMVSTNPLDNAAPWKCQKCERLLPAKTMRFGNESVSREIDDLDRVSPKSLETFLLKYDETLHPNNAHVLRVKHELTQMYGTLPGFTLSEMNDAGLERQIDLCNDLLEISDKLDPGWSKFRGCLLLNLQAALVVQAKRNYNDEEILKEDAQEIMNEAMILLQEAVQILSPEPEMKCVLEEKLKTLAEELEFD